MTQPGLEAAIAKLRAMGCELELRNVQLGGFGDSPELSAKLIALVLSGAKTATAGTPQAWADDGAELAAPGDHEITLSSDGEPVCVLETVQLQVVPFREVTAEFAALEGEGDLTLGWWRAAHERYFRREGERLGYEFREDMPIVCQQFRLAWRAPESPR